MRIDWWTLGLQTVNLLVLLWLLGRFLFRPLARIVAERQQAANRLLDDAQAERQKAQAAATAERDAAAAGRGALIEQARQDAEAQRAALLEAANEEARQLRAQAEAAIEHLRAEEDQRIGRRASLLATDIAARLMQRLPGPVPVAGFLPGLEQALAALPEAARAALGTPGQPVVLRLAGAPGAGEQAQCADALARALGRRIDFTLQTDPALIAGLRLEAPTAVVDNNLRADVDRIARELTEHA
ncbi:F0F1 ATP synthase subunit delta [Pseudorhodoferax sp.]|uniref:F0F1 ATP synthase subunit delta n=1 Tax=Pseudorhodoferax sp. TaxID=1993553 RepID=UPI0039E57AF6